MEPRVALAQSKWKKEALCICNNNDKVRKWFSDQTWPSSAVNMALAMILNCYNGPKFIIMRSCFRLLTSSGAAEGRTKRNMIFAKRNQFFKIFSKLSMIREAFDNLFLKVILEFYELKIKIK